MEQTKALNALEPFLALSKSANSPRAAADLITRATSAPNTFIFAELLQTPQITALASSPEFAPHHKLLQIFSHGTYQTYKSAQGGGGLPALNEAQTLKLRQLSLLSLVRDRENLSYGALQKNLELESARELEDLVITAVYAGLLNATLDPARQAVQVLSVASMRDLSPGAIPEMTSILKLWSERCTSTLGDIEGQVQSIRDAAVVREKETKLAEEKLKNVMNEVRNDPSGNISRQGLAKRAGAPLRDDMELDDPFDGKESKSRVGKRKM